MGNILESDTSSSETEKEESHTDLKEEVRTSGDGMESENNDAELKPGIVNQIEGISQSLVGFTLGGDHQRNRFDETSETLLNDKKWCSSLPVKVLSVDSPKQSPNQLPPRDKLIVLRVPSKSPSDPNSNTSFNKMVSSNSGKQREPKFVPYEPYKGATRSMTEDPAKSSHSRKPSFGSTTSTTSLNAPVELKSVPSTSKMSIVENSSNITNVVKVQENVSNNLDLEDSGQSVLLLMKERLKIHEKDINELRVENSRLKKMLVDSLSGFGSAPTMNPMSPTRSKSSESESFDNLTDEISVWRSKFLSTCVLVEQLTKQNQDLKLKVNGAMELFRDMKQSPDILLTPLFFENINSWIHQNVNYNLNNNNSLHHDSMLNGTSSSLNYLDDSVQS